MSKPIGNVIKLSKRLNKLGYRQDIKQGDWHYGRAGKEVLLWSREDVYFDSGGQGSQEHIRSLPGVRGSIPIPSLEDGLEWLDEQVGFHHTVEISWDGTEKAQYWCECHFLIEKDKRCGKTRHEAVLLAMIKVLEAKQ